MPFAYVHESHRKTYVHMADFLLQPFEIAEIAIFTKYYKLAERHQNKTYYLANLTVFNKSIEWIPNLLKPVTFHYICISRDNYVRTK